MANKDLSEIFDSTYAISELKVLPFNFVDATEKLYSDIKYLEDKLLYEIYNPRKKLEDSVSSFLSTSHNLMFKIFNNLTELSDALSTENSKIVGISSYYLNNTDDSYYEIIKNATKILDNYYINEKNNFSKLFDPIIQRFYENTINITQNCQSSLDDISDRLNDGSITIIHGYTEHYQKVISNIYNTKIKAKEIIETVKNKFQGALKLKSNGYFETQEELDQNSQSYGQIGTKALTISYSLDNNEFIDKTFDNVMTSFRDKYMDLLKYMENSIKYKSMLDNISGRLSDGNLLIKLATTEQYQSSISNIYNSKIKVNEIIETIKTKFQESIKFQSNGYFETQQEIDQNSQSYGEKGEKALKTSYSLDNNEFIDKTFDSVMTSFRDKFIELLKYMDNSIKDKFPLEQNVLGTSLFNALFLEEIDDFFQTEKINMLNFINNENDEYLKSVNGLLNNFTNTEGKSLEQIISDLMNSMTDIY